MISLMTGHLYLWGIISLYVTSYFRSTQNSGLTNKSTDIVFATILLGQAAIQPFCPLLLKNFSARSICLTASLVLSLSLYTAAFITSLGYFELIYGIFGGMAAGILQGVPITHCYKYFPNSKTLVSCLIVICAGVGTVLMSLMGYHIINSHN